MRNFKIIIGLLFIFAALCACKDDRIDTVGAVVSTSGKINAFASSELVLTEPEAEQNPFLARMTWSKSKFAHENGDYVHVTDIMYSLEADLVENNFSQPILLTETPNLYADLYTKDVKNLVDELSDGETNEPKDISFRIKTTTNYGEIYSEPLTVTVKSYLNVEPKIYNIYVIGEMNGWDPNNKDFITFRDTNNVKDGKHTYTGYFSKDTYLKFCKEENLGDFTKMLGLDNGQLAEGDYDAFFVQAGYKTITIDVINMTWKIEDFDGTNSRTYDTIGPIGNFCNWDNEPPMTKSVFDPHQWKITYKFNASTALKFRGNKDWANNWGGRENELPYGKAIFDGPGATIDVGEYDIHFNDLTGHYLIKKN